MGTIPGFPAYRGVSTRNEVFDYSSLAPGGSFVEAGDGDDYVFPSSGKDSIYGQGGRDLIRAQSGDDVIYGDYTVDDTATPTPAGFTQAAAADLIDAGTGDDVVYASNGNDYVWGEEGRDLIFGGSGDDLLLGGADDDRVYGEAGNDVIYGGGTQTVDNAFFAPITTDFNGLNDVAIGPVVRDANTSASFSNQSTGTGNDVLDGGAGNDIIIAQDGNDTAYGGDGDDAIDEIGRASCRERV